MGEGIQLDTGYIQNILLFILIISIAVYYYFEIKKTKTVIEEIIKDINIIKIFISKNNNGNISSIDNTDVLNESNQSNQSNDLINQEDNTIENNEIKTNRLKLNILIN